MWCENVEWSEIDCGEVLSLLERYIDHEVPPEAREPIEQHLVGCRDCLERKEFRVRLQEIVRSKCARADLPSGLEEKIRSALIPPG
jgi:anti-sigma factor (TIGR02949 family)